MVWRGVPDAGVPARDRFEWFSEMLAASLAPMRVSSDSTADFEAEAAVLELGPVQLSRFVYSPLRTQRTEALIRRADPEQYHLGWVRAGRMEVDQGGNTSGPVTGDMVLMDTSRPQRAVASGAGGGSGRTEALVLQVPRAALPLRARRVDRMVAQRIPAGAGMAAILARFLAALHTQGPECRPGDQERLGTLALELTASCLAERLGVLADEPPEARPLALRERIDAFIDHNLGDPELTPRMVAEHHHLSLRSLYALFEDEEVSVAGRIRLRRLERCRDDLAGPALRAHTVRAIAARWGFTDGSVFSRAFREAYGMSPSEHRRAAEHADTAGHAQRSALPSGARQGPPGSSLSRPSPQLS
ncbi:helix-turn-helix domain-containing protein [Streptomyces griseosporeus]|uniref:AraC-like ligand-binding domain-containing protein n=1 Tax=Streptomyces griseosporeus TaxID=1910 RepID=UPI00167C5138|nr:helix-turn-helix domain-containing protein [Streptomyces griseosporeus]GHF51567.1 AraC family transcriptional regulator [Streptomyces griseosporeus]